MIEYVALAAAYVFAFGFGWSIPAAYFGDCPRFVPFLCLFAAAASSWAVLA